MTASLQDEITGAFIYPANDNPGARHSRTLRISGRVHPAALRIKAERCCKLWRAKHARPADFP
jgi:hypothetical protein